jgi:hypothetical protein
MFQLFTKKEKGKPPAILFRNQPKPTPALLGVVLGQISLVG